MACTVIRSADGSVIAIACGSPWGIGVYFHCHRRRCFCGGQPVYGFPPSQMNPEDFTPDRESCTPEEIAAWEEARAAYRDAKATP